MLGSALSVLDERAPAEAASIRTTLRFIAAADLGYSFALPDVGGYVTPFSDAEMAGIPLLASKLVWAGTFIETLLSQQKEGGRVDRDVAREAAVARAREFVASLPDSAHWLDLLPTLYGEVR